MSKAYMMWLNWSFKIPNYFNQPLEYNTSSYNGIFGKKKSYKQKTIQTLQTNKWIIIKSERQTIHGRCWVEDSHSLRNEAAPWSGGAAAATSVSFVKQQGEQTGWAGSVQTSHITDIIDAL